MRKRISLFALVWLISLVGAMADDYLMPKFGYETKTVSKDDAPLIFYDNAGTGSFASTAFYSQSTVVFKPATEGYAIQVTFEELELHNYNNSTTTNYKCYLKVYDGTFDENSVTYGTSNYSINEFPDNEQMIASYKGEDIISPMPVLVSAAADGSLSFCFYAKDPSPASSPGWKATVTEVLLETMTVTSAAGNNSFVNGEVWAGKQNVGMAGLGITTEGYSSPDQLQTLTFTCNNSSVVDPTALQLYAGQAASTAGMTALAGTITESAGVYTYTLTEPYALSNGNNKFMLAGDILSSAAFNTTAQVNITGITTVGGFTSFTTATPATLTVAAMYLMAEGASYTVNGSADFYDEGGKDGKVVKGFDGKVVFTPATSGSKVKLTFNSINVFYTDYAANSTGYVDYIKVYNGNSTEEADLIWQLSQAEASSTTAIVLKSTAADGKLTITHKNNISYDSNLKDGWEATVSEFVPQAMTVSNVAVTKETGTVSAGTEGKQVACIKVVTAETEPALTVASIALNTNNTNAQIKKAKLYYTKENSFSTSNLIGEATVDANTVTISKSNDINFREGDNYLWVVCDINELAQNGEKVNVTVTELAFTNLSSVSEFGSQSGELTIENKAVQACGEQTFTVQGDWQYTHTVASEYSSKYLAEQCDQTVIFKPATAGNVIQVDYADFDVYYSTSAYYGARAKYIVYDGEGTSGAILWQLDANGKKPTQIRSTGAMTIVFNPNTTSSSYTGNGWHATVKEYTPKNMAVTDVTVEQASTRLVSLGEEKAAMLNVNIQTEGTLSPLTLDAMSVSLKGTEANISNVYLLQGTTVVAQATAAATTVLTLTTPVTLNEYDNEFTIAVDIKADATVEQTVDAALLSLTINGAAQSVSAGDPEGSRIIKNILLLQAGDNGTKQIGATSLMFYDDGGADGTYTKNIEGYVTFVPEHEGYAVEVVVNNYKLSSGAPVKIYYGTNHDGDADATVQYDYSEPTKYAGQSFISSAADGSLTVYFKDQSYGSANEGWEFEVREHLLTNLSIESVTATSVASALQTVGAKDLQMLQIAVVVTGDRTPITIDAISVAPNEYVDGTKLYQTGKVATFSDSESFTAPYVISERGTYYFWVTADASATADDDDIMTVSLTAIQSGTETILPSAAVTAQTKLAHGMQGTYYIGQSTVAMPTDFTTVASAKDAMATLGIEGNVTFYIVPGNYSERVTLDAVNGTSSAATITFQSATGNAADVVFSSDETSDTEGVWTINGTDYLTLKNISFKSNRTGYAAVLVLKNQSQHVTVDGCVLSTSVTGNSTSQNMQLIRLISEDADNANCSYFTLQNSSLTGGYMGINLSQGAYATHPNMSNIQILNNSFNGQEKQMVYGTMVKDVTVSGNTMTQTNYSQADFRAIDLRTKIEGTFTIANNTIILNGNNYANAIYLGPTSAANCAEGTVANIYNNAVSVSNESTSLSSAVQLRYMREVNMTYNTLLMNANGINCVPLAIYYGANLALNATNNIFQNAGTGYVMYYSSAAFAKGTYTKNAFYAQSGTFSNQAATFAEWEALSTITSTNNMVEQAVFASNSLLILKEAGSLVSATPIATITTDIDGKERAAIPTIGAYEYDAEMLNIPVMAEGYPKAQNIQDITADIAVKADNKGTAKVLVVAATEAAPAKETVIADGVEVTLQANTEVTVTIDGLTEETTYIAYVVLLSPIGEAADAVAATEAFATAWTLRPVQVTAIAEQTVAENANVTLTATLVNEYEQAKPYTYKWYTAYDETEIGNGATLNTTVTRTTEYICCVTDRFNQKGYVSAHVNVTKAATAATFEEYNLPAGGNKYVDDAWADGVETYLYSGTYAFANTPNKAWNAYNGYAICSDNSTEATGNFMIDQFRSAAGGAYEGNNFAVAYYAAPSSSFAGYFDPIQLTCSDQPQTISGFYITNTVYTLDAILNGDYANGAFAQGDYMTVTAKGFNGGVQTGEAVFYLADYRSTNSAEHYAVDTWEWFDLTSLGAVTDLQFEVFTTKGDAYGFTTPTYFCLDNFGGEQPQEDMYIDVTEGQWGTLCLPYDLAADGHSGLEVFHSDYLNTEENRLYLLEETGIFGKGLPMVYHALTTGRIYLNRASSAETDTNVSGEENGFHASLEGMAAGTLTGKYVINPADYLVYECSATAWLRPNRCYWDDIMSPSFPHQTAYPTAAPQRRRAIGANRPNTPTGVEQPSDTTAPRKIILDGQMYIEREGHLYNAAGQYIR